MEEFVVVGNISDDPFSLDIGYLSGQQEDISDIIALKTYANSEFCPRFLLNEESDYKNIGQGLKNKIVIICSTTHHSIHTRNSLVMRTFLIASAAKENGAKKVILIEPDLFYSAQDRGPHCSKDEKNRSEKDCKKFDGQPFSSKLYANLLKQAGVDVVVTIHNHSYKVQDLFKQVFPNNFYNLIPQDIIADYIQKSDILNTNDQGANLILCAPDKGAAPFVHMVKEAINLPKVKVIQISKERLGERNVQMKLSEDSQCEIKDLKGKDILILDDMVRTGNTVIECCKLLATGNTNRICFGVTHFYSSNEGRSVLNSPYLDEILTLNTIPSILNRDMQGRLRRKIVVLKIEKWISSFLLNYMNQDTSHLHENLYTVDMSSKNPRWATNRS